MRRLKPVSLTRFGLAWLVLIATPLGCGPPAPQQPNILILSIDTLRADHLGSYGYSENTSPNLDAFARGAVRYANAYAPAPWTLPSHAAMLTGRHPYEIGIVDLNSSLPVAVSPLAVDLQSAGYQTAAFVDSSPSGLLGAQRGFGRGFDVFRHAPHGEHLKYPYDMAKTVEVGLEWLARRKPDRPFFLFLHTKSVHSTPAEPALLAESDAPYDKPLPYRTLFVPTHELRFKWSSAPDQAGVNYLRGINERIGKGDFDPHEFPPAKIAELIGLYDGGIYYVDHQFNRLLAGISELGLDGNTVIVVTADHGEAFLDHLFFLHKEVYTGLLHVPLILRDPRDPQVGVVDQRVGLVDIAPTLLDLAGLPVPDAMSGRVLPRHDVPEAPERSFFSFFEFDEDYLYSAFSLHEGRWKLVHHKLASWSEPRTDLYDTESDPDQQHPLDGENERKRAMLARLIEWTETQRGTENEIEIDPESAKQLRALGYLK